MYLVTLITQLDQLVEKQPLNECFTCVVHFATKGTASKFYSPMLQIVTKHKESCAERRKKDVNIRGRNFQLVLPVSVYFHAIPQYFHTNLTPMEEVHCLTAHVIHQMIHHTKVCFLQDDRTKLRYIYKLNMTHH